MKKLQHTPEGVRDIYNIECGKKLSLESRLHKVLQMPTYCNQNTSPQVFSFLQVQVWQTSVSFFFWLRTYV